jgi:Lon protease-like protein
MESGTRKFGMITYLDEPAEYGTMLEIESVQMLPDGRSLLETTGSRRFKILERGVKDGYMIAKIEWIEDEPLKEGELELTTAICSNLKTIAISWINSMNTEKRLQFFAHFGPLPDDNIKFSWWMASILPIPQHHKYNFLKTKSMLERLQKIQSFIVE